MKLSYPLPIHKGVILCAYVVIIMITGNVVSKTIKWSPSRKGKDKVRGHRLIVVNNQGNQCHKTDQLKNVVSFVVLLGKEILDTTRWRMLVFTTPTDYKMKAVML